MTSLTEISRQSIVESRHARVRSRQRCIPALVRDLVLDFGVAKSAGGGAQRYHFDKKSWRGVEAYLGTQAKHYERYRDVFVLLSSDSVVVTVGWIH